ncbi:aminotransferase class I/II-fold pyridoxal phosphate-dependent enzyme [Clostridium tyrobutyricum]|jgi:DNA-binding transcriptional MocR family regulator|uniref:Transcriptional regulator, GntR family domain / Aspartate aminotransferase n=1 Tax=Clostridium tyrobutyricum DIVETGP TaxID=1408889 RepID=W6N474_CLOTY|nr:PLP-dependent aminotransferase family protein [Clostridium tyrobutyricum]AND84189.1 transcriptional regulator [Clostridium tyrobutyricum]ANP68915.1 GntR family transcriptional regulator [Clostridium tyrobutyricum]MBR9648816.1 PLP-dependent aminotransferase family protein [Clostridium tyrobutyricum]MBV4415928.1 PLP-dependent aminotransferase family protein [Clostridium tyrobutyricum]MBV4421805.1 PLP-dependent aminotransferase family protein [Clostridium tyrobutyricum]
MFFDIKIDKKSPVYIQLKNYIKNMILRGMMASGEKLPSTREMASRLKISRNTVMCAYDFLKDDGLIYMKKGKGAFVADVKVDFQEKWNVDWSNRINNYAKKATELDIIKSEVKWEKGMISFKSIAPDDKLFDVENFKKSFLNCISREGGKILNYGYAQGYKSLIKYLLKYMENKGINTTEKDIIITNGFTEGFDLILSCLTNAGDSVICENPTHNTAIKIMKLHKLNIVGVAMDEDGINLKDLKIKLTRQKPKLSYFIPSYHNPTGIVMPPEKRTKLYNILRENNIPIVEDGFNEELRYLSDHVSPIAALSGNGNSVIYIGSFSKILFPGIRIGWILADKQLIGYIESLKRSRNIHTSFLDQAVFYDYLKEGNFEKYIKKVRRFYKDKYEKAIDFARKYIPYSKIYGEGGLHIFIEVYGIDSRKLLNRCCKRGVIFTPGDIFYTDGGGGNTFRLGFSRVSDEDIERGFKIIGEEIKKLKSV